MYSYGSRRLNIPSGHHLCRHGYAPNPRFTLEPFSPCHSEAELPSRPRWRNDADESPPAGFPGPRRAKPIAGDLAGNARAHRT